MTPRKLPTWEQSRASDKDEAASTLELFIYEYEPCGTDDNVFRRRLVDVLNNPDAELPKFVAEFEPADRIDNKQFMNHVDELLGWIKAFSSGCPGVIWEA